VGGKGRKGRKGRRVPVVVEVFEVCPFWSPEFEFRGIDIGDGHWREGGVIKGMVVHGVWGG